MLPLRRIATAVRNCFGIQEQESQNGEQASLLYKASSQPTGDYHDASYLHSQAVDNLQSRLNGYRDDIVELSALFSCREAHIGELIGFAHLSPMDQEFMQLSEVVSPNPLEFFHLGKHLELRVRLSKLSQNDKISTLEKIETITKKCIEIADFNNTISIASCRIARKHAVSDAGLTESLLYNLRTVEDQEMRDVFFELVKKQKEIERLLDKLRIEAGVLCMQSDINIEKCDILYNTSAPVTFMNTLNNNIFTPALYAGFKKLKENKSTEADTALEHRMMRLTGRPVATRDYYSSCIESCLTSMSEAQERIREMAEYIEDNKPRLKPCQFFRTLEQNYMQAPGEKLSESDENSIKRLETSIDLCVPRYGRP